jgi:hypothetical protein
MLWLKGLCLRFLELTMIKCTKVEVTDKRTLRCVLSDGRIVEYHVKSIDDFDTDMTRPLKDEKYFNKVFLEFGAPTWPNGFDICADKIAQDGKVVGKEELPA